MGAHVVDHLLRQGMDVVALDDLSGGFRENISPQAVFVEETVTNREGINRLFATEKFDYVFHLAAYAAEGLSHFIRNFNYTNNLIGSVNLINASLQHNIKCFVFTSSIAVYGSAQTPMTEATIPQPEDPYGISKYAVELDLASARHQFGLNYIVFRPHNVYGERQNIGDKYRNVIGIFMNQVMQGQPLSIFGDGTQTRAFSYIDDVAPVIAASITNTNAYNGVFNVGGDTPYSVNELAATVLRAMDAEGTRIQHVKARNEVLHAFSSHEKLAATFDLPNETSLEDGIRKMAAWAREYGPRASKDLDGIEIPDGLPEGW